MATSATVDTMRIAAMLGADSDDGAASDGADADSADGDDGVFASVRMKVSEGIRNARAADARKWFA
eukprot:6074883-Pyramimonas_sp.AAC.1